jgi:hypothetical protein
VASVSAVLKVLRPKVLMEIAEKKIMIQVADQDCSTIDSEDSRGRIHNALFSNIT